MFIASNDNNHNRLGSAPQAVTLLHCQSSQGTRKSGGDLVTYLLQSKYSSRRLLCPRSFIILFLTSLQPFKELLLFLLSNGEKNSKRPGASPGVRGRQATALWPLQKPHSCPELLCFSCVAQKAQEYQLEKQELILRA
jgi:hypothetical protein